MGGRVVEIQNAQGRRKVGTEELPIPFGPIAQTDVQGGGELRQDLGDARRKVAGKVRLAGLRQGPMVFGREPRARCFIERYRAAHRFFVAFAHQGQRRPVHARGDRRDRFRHDRHERLRVTALRDGVRANRLGHGLQIAGGERQAVPFGEVRRDFAGGRTGQLEADHFGQQRRGRPELELTLRFQRANRRAARAGLIEMAGDGQRAIKRLIVPDASFFAVIDLLRDLDLGRANFLLAQQARGQFLTGELQQCAHRRFAFIEALARDGVPIKFVDRNGHFVCLGMDVYGSFHLRPSG